MTDDAGEGFLPRGAREATETMVASERRAVSRRPTPRGERG